MPPSNAIEYRLPRILKSNRKLVRDYRQDILIEHCVCADRMPSFSSPQSMPDSLISSPRSRPQCRSKIFAAQDKSYATSYYRSFPLPSLEISFTGLTFRLRIVMPPRRQAIDATQIAVHTCTRRKAPNREHARSRRSLSPHRRHVSTLPTHYFRLLIAFRQLHDARHRLPSPAEPATSPRAFRLMGRRDIIRLCADQPKAAATAYYAHAGQKAMRHAFLFAAVDARQRSAQGGKLFFRCFSMRRRRAMPFSAYFAHATPNGPA